VFLSYKKDSDTPAIQARRATCAEIAEIANRDDSPVIAVAQKAWGEWVAYLIEQVENVPDEQKPRYGAMLATAQRELAELSEW
jgi:hypothetical protein